VGSVEKSPLHVLIADPSEFSCAGIRAVLSDHGLENVECVRDAASTITALATARFDVALIDMDLSPDVRAIREVFSIAVESGATCLAVGLRLDVADVCEAACLGASGYLTKDTSASRWIQAIEVAARGELAFPRAVVPLLVEAIRRASTLPTPASERQLTPREWEVLRSVSEGMTNRAIAATLHISPETVATHVSNILSKLNAPSRAAAASRYQTLSVRAASGWVPAADAAVVS
jgi:DNA-binding NarL/FixJ family response regulator